MKQLHLPIIELIAMGFTVHTKQDRIWMNKSFTISGIDIVYRPLNEEPWRTIAGEINSPLNITSRLHLEAFIEAMDTKELKTSQEASEFPEEQVTITKMGDTEYSAKGRTLGQYSTDLESDS